MGDFVECRFDVMNQFALGIELRSHEILVHTGMHPICRIGDCLDEQILTITSTCQQFV